MFLCWALINGNDNDAGVLTNWRGGGMLWIVTRQSSHIKSIKYQLFIEGISERFCLIWHGIMATMLARELIKTEEGSLTGCPTKLSLALAPVI